MAYNNYFPATYAPYTPTPSVATPAVSNPINWVQGESGAKSFNVPPNSTVLLMDSEQDRFYIKSADASGMPSPLRVFEYTETTMGTNPASFVTKDEFEELKAEVLKLSKPTARKVKTDE